MGRPITDADVENQKLGIILRRMLKDKDEVYSDIEIHNIHADEQVVKSFYRVTVDGSHSISADEYDLVGKVMSSAWEEEDNGTT